MSLDLNRPPMINKLSPLLSLCSFSLDHGCLTSVLVNGFINFTVCEYGNLIDLFGTTCSTAKRCGF